jgi:hypothetical protein
LAALVAAALTAGCNPTFSDRPSLVSGPRVLAVRGEPAEARPGTPIAYRVLVGGGDDAAAAWSTCNVPKPLDENNVVAAGCLQAGGLVPIGVGAEVTAPLPLKACQLFGPDPPPPMPGQPPLRPRDPDVSGGYYQPVRVDVGGVIGFGLERITCNLAAAGAEIAVAYAQRYTANQNPTLLPLAAAVAGAPVALDAIPAGARVTFTAAWPPESAEHYPIYDLTQQALVDHRESLRVSWFATAGSFAHDRTGRGEDELETSSDNDWTAPTDGGPVSLWVVLRDSRGGVVFDSRPLTVVP